MRLRNWESARILIPLFVAEADTKILFAARSVVLQDHSRSSRATNTVKHNA